MGIDVADESRDAMRRVATAKNAKRNISAKTTSIIDYANEQLNGVTIVSCKALAA